MEQFKKNGLRIINNSKVELEEEYQNILNQYQRIFKNRIIDCIQETIRGIPEYKLEEWIDEFLISELKSFGNRQNNNISSEFEQNFAYQLKYLPDDSKYRETSPKAQLSRIEDLIDEFRRTLLRKMEHYYDAFRGFDDRQFDRCIDDINYELKRQLSKTSDQFIDEYQQLIKQIIRKQNQKLSSHFESFVPEHKTLSTTDVSRIAETLHYNNFDLIVENGRYFAKNRENNEVIELNYDGKQDSLRDKSDNLVIGLSQRPSILIYNSQNKQIMYNWPSFTYICNSDKTNLITIKKSESGYIIESNYKPVENRDQLIAIFTRLKEKFPVYYTELTQHPQYHEIAELLGPVEIKQEPKEDYASYFKEGPEIYTQEEPSTHRGK